MSNALSTGVSGLRAHQQQLDVVANNLANMNTTSFKSQLATFSDLSYDTIRSGSGAGQTIGGVDPHQIGSGVEIGEISRNFTQGALESTGELLDFAIQGDGFFVLEGANGESVYTRAGSFALDERGDLVDPASGYRVQRNGSLGERTDDQFGFQVDGDNSINIPLGAAIPGSQTEKVDFFGNLPTDASPPLAEVLTSSEPFTVTGTGAVATGATTLNDLAINSVDYVPGDSLDISGTNPDGTPYATTLANADTATVQDLVDQINTVLVDAVAEFTGGSLQITATETGEAFGSLTIEDSATNTAGVSDFLQNSMVVSTEGGSGDTHDVSFEIFDERGDDHRVNFQFRKESTNSWSLVASVDESSGVTVDGQVNNIVFRDNGSFALSGETGDGDNNIEISFNSVNETQTIDLTFENMSHTPEGGEDGFSASLVQDGTPPGTLTSIAVNGNGELSGLASNGKVIELAQMSIARFSNVGALDALGGNFFQESPNSGAAAIGDGLTGGRGQVIGNQLEGSNVDLAQEFTRLIVAQRGFSANARTITVADEVLEELTNIIR